MFFRSIRLRHKNVHNAMPSQRQDEAHDASHEVVYRHCRRHGERRKSCPAKNYLSFSLAEGIAKERVGKVNDDNKSKDYCLDFFKFASADDKKRLQTGIRRSFLGTPHSNLRLTSIIKMLYIVRSDAVHGRIFWEFSLAESRDDKYTLMTRAKLGKPTGNERLPSMLV